MPFRNDLFINAAVIMKIGHSLFGVKLLCPHREQHLNINGVARKTQQLFPCFLQFNEELFDADPVALQMNGGDCEKMISYQCEMPHWEQRLVLSMMGWAHSNHQFGWLWCLSRCQIFHKWRMTKKLIKKKTLNGAVSNWFMTSVSQGHIGWDVI